MYFELAFAKAERTNDIHYYLKAANETKDKQKIGICYEKAAKLELLCDSKYRAANFFAMAGDNYSNFNIDFAVDCYLNAVELFSTNGNFITTAKLYSKLAEIYLAQNNLSKAIEYYEKCHYFLNLEKSELKAIEFLLKAAYLLIRLNKYKEAILYLEKCRDCYIRNNLIIPAKSLNFEITILKIYKNKNHYVLLDKDNYNNNDYKFLTDIDNYIKSVDIKNLDDRCRSYASLKKFDPWLIKILNKIANDLTRHKL